MFSAAGLKKPDISILSDEFLAEVRGLKHKNVAAELLAKLLGGEIKTRAKRQLVQSRVFSDMLKKTLNAYHNRAIATQEIIEELIRLAKEMRDANRRGEDLGLTDDEIAFYDALAVNESAVKAMGSDELKVIAAELVTEVRKSVTIDWTVRESARAKIRVMVRRILRKHGYPPDLQEEATRTAVLEQAELMCADWALVKVDRLRSRDRTRGEKQISPHRDSCRYFHSVGPPVDSRSDRLHAQAWTLESLGQCPRSGRTRSIAAGLDGRWDHRSYPG